MTFDEQRECFVNLMVFMRDKKEASAGAEKKRHLRPRLVQKVAEGNTSLELSWKLNEISMSSIPPYRAIPSVRMYYQVQYDAAVGLIHSVL